MSDGLDAQSNPDNSRPGADLVTAEPALVTPADIKEVSQEMLRYGFIEEQRKSALFRRAATHHKDIENILEPFDLALRLDEHRGVAFLVVAESAYGPDGEVSAWTHPLVRRQRLTLEQSLLIALLRQVFVLHEQEAGVGASPAKIAVEELLPQFLSYFEDSGSDAKNTSRLSSLLDQLKTYGIVSEVDTNDEVVIRPLIAHLANPQSLQALLRALVERSTNPGELAAAGTDSGEASMQC